MAVGYTGIYLEGMRKTVKNLGQYSGSAGRDLKCTLMNARRWAEHSTARSASAFRHSGSNLNNSESCTDPVELSRDLCRILRM